jgi:hypothetical protein
MKETSKLANQTSNLTKSKGGKKSKKDYSKISDKELRERVNRLNLERNYANLTGDSRRGADFVRESLQTLGSVLAVGTTAVSLYITLKSRGINVGG